MPEKKIEVKDKVETKSKAKAKKAPAGVKLEWPHNVGLPGQKRTFYGVECEADGKGVFTATVPKETADVELARENRKTFKKG